MKILIIDNYDSFTYNLYHLVEAVMPSDYSLKVKRNDETDINEIKNYDKIIISPGPGLPKDAGISCEAIEIFGGSKSILGVCLGHQAIAEAYGAKLKNLDEVLHGIAIETLPVIKSEKLFHNCPAKFDTGRYHSWVVDKDTVPECLEVTAVDSFGHIMALRHKHFDVKGVQFHPESIMTSVGKQIIKNWIDPYSLK